MVVQNKTRKANQKLKLTPNQINELKKCSNPNDGYINFINQYCYVNCNGIVKYTPYDYQITLLNALHNYEKVVCILARQLGKCFFENTNITIKNKHSGEIKTLTVGEFYELSKKDL